MPAFKFPLTVDDQQHISDTACAGYVPPLLDLAVKGQNTMESVLQWAEEAKPRDIEALVAFRRDAIALLKRVLKK
jgi:hypothetical protein